MYYGKSWVLKKVQKFSFGKYVYTKSFIGKSFKKFKVRVWAARPFKLQQQWPSWFVTKHVYNTQIDQSTKFVSFIQFFGSDFDTSQQVSAYFIVSILHYVTSKVYRDWSEAGASVREKLYYQGVLSVISRVFPPNPLNYGATAMPLVLVPGAGLGRLGVEIASMGFR